MASFATEAKNELARHKGKKRCCQNAELAALLRMGAEMPVGANTHLGLHFITENAAVARRALQLLKATGQVQPEVAMSRAKSLRKNNRYILRVAPSPLVRPLLEELGILPNGGEAAGKEKNLLRKKCCRIAYLRGAFLGGGTVNRPEAQMSLEFIADNYPFAQTLAHVLRNLDFPVGMTDRKHRYRVYLKDGEEIMDLLAMLGATKAAEELEVARNLREVRNQVNRLVNCETANLQKTVQASLAQVAAIEKLQAAGALHNLPPKLKQAAEIRLANPDFSLAELGAALGISRAAANHRLQRLVQMAEELS